MTSSPLRSPLRSHLRAAVLVIKVSSISVLVLLACGVGAASLTGVPATAPPVAETTVPGIETDAGPAGMVRYQRLSAQHDCSSTGFGAEVIPGSALVLRDGAIHHVSFDDGWATFTGDAHGELLAVCRTSL